MDRAQRLADLTAAYHILEAERDVHRMSLNYCNKPEDDLLSVVVNLNNTLGYLQEEINDINATILEEQYNDEFSTPSVGIVAEAPAPLPLLINISP